MTVSSATTRNDYTATIGQTTFPYTFQTFASSDLVVLQNGVALSEGSGYSVTDVGVDAGGDVILVTGAGTGDSILIYLNMDLSRTIDYQNAGDFLSSEVNDDFDRLWLALQQGKTELESAVRRNSADSGTINMELPIAADRAQKILAFDATGAVLAQQYIGGLQVLSRDAFTGDGVTTTFTMSKSMSSSLAMNVVVAGIMQDVTSYSVVGGTSLVFSEAPPANSSIEVRSFVEAEIVSTDLSSSEFTGDGATTTFTLTTNGVKQNAFVYIGGIYQFKSTYSVSGTTITFSTAPPVASAIEVIVAGFTTSILGEPADDSVGTVQLQDGSVTTPKIADLAVTTAKIADANVTTAKIADDSVTAAKIASEPVSVGITTVVTSASMTATVNTHVVVDTATQTITLPITPTIGQRVLVTVGNFVDTVVGRNGSNIMSSATDFTMDVAYLSIQFIYIDTTQGWIIA